MQPTDFRIKPVIILFLLVIVSTWITGIVLAGTETLITTNTSGSNQIYPAISGDWIVWADDRNDDGSGYTDIYAYNVVTGTEKRITPEGSIANHPSISDNYVVYDDGRNTNDYDIFLANLNTGTEWRLTDDTHHQQFPSISGNIIVWQDDRFEDSDIFRNGTLPGQEILLTPDTTGTYQTFPVISGSKVIWEDDRNGGNDIYMNDTTLGDLYLVSPNGATFFQSDLFPSIAIDNGHIVWYRGNDIYLNDTSQITPQAEQVVNDNVPGAQKMYPSISGNNVVWVDTRNGGRNNIYLKDLTSGSDIQITTADASVYTTDAGTPKISGNRIVWVDNRDVYRDIYLYTIGNTETCPVAGFTMSSQTGEIPHTIQFTDTSTPGSTAITHWKYEFGDGNSSPDTTDKNPSWEYKVPGTYDVRLTINNPYCRDETPIDNSYKVSVGSRPIADFNVSNRSGFVPLLVRFNDTSIGATTWNWSYGDGSFPSYDILDSPLLKNVTHTYDTPGTYTATLNASNAYGFSHKTTTISALTGADETADTTISGIAISTPYGPQFITYTGTLAGCQITGTSLICTGSGLTDHGWKNITFSSNDGIGFREAPVGTIKGNISSVYLQTKEIVPGGFSKTVGASSSMNYSIVLNAYPQNANVNTQVWEGYVPDDLAAFSTIGRGSGFPDILGIAYTMKITKTNFPSGGTAKIHMSVNSTWVSNHGGRSNTYVERISDDRSTGEVLRTQYLNNDPVKNLDYFEIDSSRGASTFGLAQLTGSGNPFQLITLTAASYTSSGNNPSPADNADSPSESDGPPGPGSVSGKAQEPQVPEMYAPLHDPGKTEKLYSNANGVITQETLLKSTDNLVTLSINQGIVAKDRSGNPLSSISLAAISPENVPGSPSGFTNPASIMAYEITPDGATFSPAITLSFTIPQAQWGLEYTVKMYDQASGTWQDLPSHFDPTSGTLKTEVTHLCSFSVFAKPIATVTSTPVRAIPSAVPLKVPEAPPPDTPLTIFTSLMVWVVELVTENISLLIGAIVLLCSGYLVIRWKFPGS